GIVRFHSLARVPSGVVVDQLVIAPTQQHQVINAVDDGWPVARPPRAAFTEGHDMRVLREVSGFACQRMLVEELVAAPELAPSTGPGSQHDLCHAELRPWHPHDW